MAHGMRTAEMPWFYTASRGDVMRGVGFGRPHDDPTVDPPANPLEPPQPEPPRDPDNVPRLAKYPTDRSEVSRRKSRATYAAH